MPQLSQSLMETENWVALGFLCFLGLLAYLGAHRKIIDGIDARRARIKSELDDARRLHEEAQALLVEFERKGREAETEAEAIIAGAKAEAERLATEAKAKAEDFVTRRTKMAEAKIARPNLRRWPMYAPPPPKPRSRPRRKSSPPPPRARSPRTCWRAASKTSNKNSIRSRPRAPRSLQAFSFVHYVRFLCIIAHPQH